ncbi:hypothetical protein L484_022797 [Morus notabilis]|uniref:Secreted protein n=1 Tax=Morus notabilis TaxID=981085 RepID=W9STV4_9ROSA|nr:hypothetical protein L484_022797 [Morus notabilis]
MLTTRVIATSFILFLLIFTCSSGLAQGYGVGSGEKDRRIHVDESAGQRKTRMNHGSSRGPRKRLVNPTVQHPFQAREFPL